MTDRSDTQNTTALTLSRDKRLRKTREFQRCFAALRAGDDHLLLFGAENKDGISFSFDEIVKEINVEEVKQAANYYQKIFPFPEKDKFFEEVREIPQVKERVIHGLKDGVVLDLSFESQYMARHVDFIEKLHSYTQNEQVHARMWKHSRGAVATIVTVHGWVMGDQRLSSLVFQPGYFYSMGFDVVLFELPFHGRRKVSDNKDKIPFPSEDMILTNEAIGQAIYDLRSLTLWLRSNSTNYIGAMGMSLGGYIASLWSCLDSLSFCIPVVPLISMSDVAYKIVRNSEYFEDYKTAGFSKELMDAVYYMHCPLNYYPKLSKDQFLLIGGKKDKILPQEHTYKLWEHWGNPRLHWFNGGHLALFEREKVFNKIRNFFADLGFLI